MFFLFCTARSQLGVCALDGQIYAVGGSSMWSCVSTVEVYDPDLNEWKATTSLNTNRRSAGVCVHNGESSEEGGNMNKHESKQ